MVVMGGIVLVGVCVLISSVCVLFVLYCTCVVSMYSFVVVLVVVVIMVQTKRNMEGYTSMNRPKRSVFKFDYLYQMTVRLVRRAPPPTVWEPGSRLLHAPRAGAWSSQRSARASPTAINTTWEGESLADGLACADVRCDCSWAVVDDWITETVLHAASQHLMPVRGKAFR
jgi:hypothetical protein